MTSTCKPTRNVALDLIRVVAIVLVLWQHASEYYYIGDNLSVIHANIPLLTWMNSVARICVPLFVMISGYLLLPVSTSTATFFRRRFTRILFPWVFWCVAYAVYFMLRSGDGIATCIASVCRIPLNYGVEVGHLWYIYMLIGVYLLAPIVSPWLRQCGKRELQGYLALWMLTTLLPYLHHAGIALWGEASWDVTPRSTITPASAATSSWATICDATDVRDCRCRWHCWWWAICLLPRPSSTSTPLPRMP